MIVSALQTYRLDDSHSLKEIVKYFEPVEVDNYGNKLSSLDFHNKYFVMLYNEKISENKTFSERR